MNYINAIIDVLNNVPSGIWEPVIFGILSSSASVPVIKWLQIPSHRDGLRALTVLFISGLGYLVAYQNSHGVSTSKEYIIIHILATFAVSILTFFTATKKLRGKIAEGYNNAATRAALLNQAKLQAKIPQDNQIFSQ